MSRWCVFAHEVVVVFGNLEVAVGVGRDAGWNVERRRGPQALLVNTKDDAEEDQREEKKTQQNIQTKNKEKKTIDVPVSFCNIIRIIGVTMISNSLS